MAALTRRAVTVVDTVDAYPRPGMTARAVAVAVIAATHASALLATQAPVTVRVVLALDAAAFDATGRRRRAVAILDAFDLGRAATAFRIADLARATGRATTLDGRAHPLVSPTPKGEAVEVDRAFDALLRADIADAARGAVTILTAGPSTGVQRAAQPPIGAVGVVAALHAGALVAVPSRAGRITGGWHCAVERPIVRRGGVAARVEGWQRGEVVAEGDATRHEDADDEAGEAVRSVVHVRVLSAAVRAGWTRQDPSGATLFDALDHHPRRPCPQHLSPELEQLIHLRPLSTPRRQGSTPAAARRFDGAGRR